MYAEGSMSLATALNAYVGYKDRGGGREAGRRTRRRPSSRSCATEKLLTEEQIKTVMDPIKMTEPGIPGK
jgi:aspartate ammonia-lyase